jgi:hypothetical protein
VCCLSALSAWQSSADKAGLLFVRNLSTFLRATSARLGAAFAVLVIRLPALRSTGVADFGAQAAEPSVKLRSATHESSGGPANVRAIDA